MNTRRAVVIYASDIDDYKKDRDFHMELESTPFPIATNQTELKRQLTILNMKNIGNLWMHL